MGKFEHPYSKESIGGMSRSLEKLEKMLKIWLNTTKIEYPATNEFELKRKKLLEFLNQDKR